MPWPFAAWYAVFLKFFCNFKKKIVGSISRVLRVCESFLIVVFGGYAIEHCDQADRLGWSRFMHKRIKRALGRPDSLTHPEPGGDSAAAYRGVISTKQLFVYWRFQGF